MRRGRWAAILAAPLALAMFATACGGNADADQAVVVEWGEPESPLVPADTVEVNGGNVLDAIFAGLVKYDPKTFEPSNNMAESITPSPDRKTYTIKIKPGWTFHDGTPVKAKNFVDAWNYSAYGPHGFQGASFFEQIEGYDEVNPEDPDGDSGPKEAPKPKVDKMSGLKVVNDTTFTVTLKAPSAIFPKMLGYSAYYPLPDMFFKDRKKFEDHPIGNGPFKFEERQPNVDLTVSKYDQYKGENKAKVNKVTFKVYNDLDTAYQDLVSGELDFMRQMPASALADGRWKEELGDRAQKTFGLTSETITFPLYGEVGEQFKNPNLRKAISMAIDRESITKQVFDGAREPANGWTVPGLDHRQPNACGEACEFNPAKAKEYLKKAGGFKGTLTIEANADGGHEEWVKAVAASIRQNLGIKAEYKPIPTFAEFVQKRNSREMTGLFRAGWVADYPSQETFLSPLYRTGASSNDGEYSNKAFDAALDKANQASSPEEAEKLYAEAEKLLADDMPNIPLWSQPVLSGRSDRLASGIATPRRQLDLTTVTLAD